MGHDIQPNEITQLEGAHFWPPYRWTCDLIDLFNPIAVFDRRPHGNGRCKGPDPIPNEVGRIFCVNHALSQNFLTHLSHSLHNGFGG